MTVIKELGHIALGTRFRILTDRLMQDADKVYKSLGLDFEPRWFTVFFLINRKRQMTITELADQLGYSQPAVTQIVNSLINKKLVKSVKGRDDYRKKVITITAKGEELLLKLIPVWQDIENASIDLLSSTGYDVLHILGKLETELDRKNIHSRVMDKIKERQRSEVIISDYDPKHKKLFRELNYEWISKNFKVEDKDRKQLENPEREIIKKGGHILFAEFENEISGTVAIIRHEEKVFELAKMAVTEKARGKQVGKKLALAAIDLVKSLNAEKLFLETNTTLLPAMNLYKDLGFREVEMKKKSDYQRSTIRMELDLKAAHQVVY
ncbi:MAG: helix-turn-helix domain-containing GNAT family N-acetyltransferase [bacterium]